MSPPVLIDLLEAAAAEVAELPVVLSGSGAVTYGECAALAGTLADALVAHGLARVAVAHHDPATILAVLAASSATGTEVCLYPADAGTEEIAALADAFDHEVVVADHLGEVPGRRVLATSALGVDRPPTERSRPEHAPVLILTTGTTGERKGARHDWRRLVAPLAGRATTPGARWLVGYDLHQFAGIQLLLHVVATRSTLVVRPSRPVDAPAVMRDLAVTHASATPTYWRFLLAGLDGPDHGLAVEQITLGGEAVPPRLLEDLERCFPAARISQVYASTEFGSSVSVGDRQAGLPLSVLDRDDAAPVRFRIDDGELWVRSRIGMLGYHGDEPDPDGWRPTGDLVEVRDDRIRFVGRTSDRINVGGVKVHPLPVEEAVATVPGVSLVRAYAKPNALTGQIVAVDVVAAPGVDAASLKDQIRQACAALPRAAQPRSVSVVDHLETKGHKVVRGRTGDR